MIARQRIYLTLARRHRVDHGLAFLIAHACFPTSRRPLGFATMVSPREARAVAKTWMQGGGGDAWLLVHDVFGTKQDADITEFVEAGKRVLEQRRRGRG